jgi:hypothetical protein
MFLMFVERSGTVWFFPCALVFLVFYSYVCRPWIRGYREYRHVTVFQTGLGFVEEFDFWIEFFVVLRSRWNGGIGKFVVIGAVFEVLFFVF